MASCQLCSGTHGHRGHGAVDGSHQRDALSALVAGAIRETAGMAHERRFKADGRRLLFVDKPDRSQSQIIIGHPLSRLEERDEFLLRLMTSSLAAHLPVD